MWDLIDLFDGIGTIGELVEGLARARERGTPGRFDAADAHPGPPVPEPPPPRLPDTGWGAFAPEAKSF